MANHNFNDEAAAAIESKTSYRKELSQQSGSLVSQLAKFKGTFDTLYALSTVEEQTFLDTKFNAFKLDAKNALGL